jgi:hypothetical protein
MRRPQGLANQDVHAVYVAPRAPKGIDRICGKPGLASSATSFILVLEELEASYNSLQCLVLSTLTMQLL